MEPFIDSIEVWNIRLSDHHSDAGYYRTILAGSELERAEKFRNPDDAERFILGRGLLRRILAECLRAKPSALAFSCTAQGKPFLDTGGLEFNVSHSRDRLLIAVTVGRAVGVDIEFRRDGLDMESIARRWFAPEEQRFVQSLENPQAGFFEIWSKKEAYVKALGAGIYKDLKSFAVPTGERPFSPSLGKDPRWFFQTLEIDPAYAAAVVSETPSVQVHLRTS